MNLRALSLFTMVGSILGRGTEHGGNSWEETLGNMDNGRTAGDHSNTMGKKVGNAMGEKADNAMDYMADDQRDEGEEENE